MLLLQGPAEVVQTGLPRLGLLPLAERELRIGQQRRLLFPLAVFATALLLTSFGGPVGAGFLSWPPWWSSW